jgi:hypothetical protein
MKKELLIQSLNYVCRPAALQLQATDPDTATQLLMFHYLNEVLIIIENMDEADIRKHLFRPGSPHRNLIEEYEKVRQLKLPF